MSQDGVTYKSVGESKDLVCNSTDWTGTVVKLIILMNGSVTRVNIKSIKCDEH